MRPVDILTRFGKSSVLTPLALLTSLFYLGGCEIFGKGLVDPTETMRVSKQPLMWPVLNQLDPRDEVEPEFTSARDVRQSDLEAASTDYTIGPNDLINIAITEALGVNVESVKTTRVSESGNVSLPLVGQIKAAGKTEAELEKAVADRYREMNLIQNAQVSVTVVEARQRTFSILGLVGRPGQFQIVQSDFRLLDALTLAGDVQMQGLPYIYVIRKNKPAAPDGATPQTPPGPDPTRPRTPPVDPLEGRRGMLPQPNGAVRAPVYLMAQDQPKDEGGERKVLIDGQVRPVKPGERSQPTDASGQPAAQPGATGEQPPPDAAGFGEPRPSPFPGTTPPPTTAPADAPFEFEGPKVDPDIEIIRVPIDRLQRGELQYNITIRPNDTIIVPSPKVGEYYIGGHVGRPGVYSLTGRDITLKQAIISAGMFDGLAWPERTEVIRRVGRDRELFVRVNLPKIFAAEQSDFYLRPYDTIQVGTNALAPFLAAMRGAFRFTYGFGFIYDRNFYEDPNRFGQ